MLSTSESVQYPAQGLARGSITGGQAVHRVPALLQCPVHGGVQQVLMNERRVTEDPKVKFSLSRGMPYPVTFQMIPSTQTESASAGKRVERVGGGCWGRQGW